VKTTDKIKIYSQVSENKTLMDRRPQTYGMIFGKVSDLCRQLGIDMTVLKNCIEFSAPKPRLQLFAEKLHFSLTPFSYDPM